MPTAVTIPQDHGIPVLLSLADIVYLLDGQVHEQTVYRWNHEGGRARVMPDPDWTFGVKSPTPMWHESHVIAFLKSKGYKVPPSRMNDIRRAQGALPYRTRAKSL